MVARRSGPALSHRPGEQGNRLPRQASVKRSTGFVVAFPQHPFYARRGEVAEPVSRLHGPAVLEFVQRCQCDSRCLDLAKKPQVPAGKGRRRKPRGKVSLRHRVCDPGLRRSNDRGDSSPQDNLNVPSACSPGSLQLVLPRRRVSGGPRGIYRRTVFERCRGRGSRPRGGFGPPRARCRTVAWDGRARRVRRVPPGSSGAVRGDASDRPKRLSAGEGNPFP